MSAAALPRSSGGLVAVSPGELKVGGHIRRLVILAFLPSTGVMTAATHHGAPRPPCKRGAMTYMNITCNVHMYELVLHVCTCMYWETSCGAMCMVVVRPPPHLPWPFRALVKIAKMWSVIFGLRRSCGDLAGVVTGTPNATTSGTIRTAQHCRDRDSIIFLL